MFQTRPWIYLPEESESESEEENSEENQDTLDQKDAVENYNLESELKQEPVPEPSMFDYMYERIPTENEFGLLIQARIKRMLVEGSLSRRHQELIPCPTREMEWIDHHNPYEGYDGSDAEEDNTTIADYEMENYDVQHDNDVTASIDSLFGREDNDN